jgi:hypothetical protein
LGIGKDELEIVDEQRANVTRQELVDDLRFAALVVCLVIARHKTNNAAYEEYISQAVAGGIGVVCRHQLHASCELAIHVVHEDHKQLPKLEDSLLVLCCSL